MHWQQATIDATARAHDAGALVPLGTRTEVLHEDGLTYVVRIMDKLNLKPQSGGAAPPADPFAPPYDPDLFVGELAPDHAVLLNKFPVLDPHLLIITRANEAQTDLPTAADFEALLRVLQDWDGLGFYNGGPDAGSSQPHKHLQVVSRDIAPGEPDLPLTRALADIDRLGDGIGTSPHLPYPHVCMCLPAQLTADPAAGAATLCDRLPELFAALGLPVAGAAQPAPYNLLVTRDWMCLIPRRHAEYKGLPMNAINFTGALLVIDDEQLAILHAEGPAACLRAVCGA